MRIKIKFEFNKAKEFFKKLPKILAGHAFLTFLGFLVLVLIFGGLIFYQYGFLIKKGKVEISEKPIQFKEKTYKAVLEFWQERQKKFEEADSKTYPDPFK